MSNIVITEMLSSSNQAEQQQEEATSMAEYVVEEPYDYIFEPNHYPKPSMDQPHEQVNHQHRRLIEEKDGILIYEQCSSTDRFENSSSVYQHHHLNALIRNISLSKRPGTGFGFDLSRNDADFVYVSQIMPDSPAEFCLQIGDVIIEIDEMNPMEKFEDIASLNDYLNRLDNVLLMAVHHSNYMRLKSENEEINSYCCSNCKDIVIVALRENQDNPLR